MPYQGFDKESFLIAVLCHNSCIRRTAAAAKGPIPSSGLGIFILSKSTRTLKLCCSLELSEVELTAFRTPLMLHMF